MKKRMIVAVLVVLLVVLSTGEWALVLAQDLSFSLDRNISHVYINKDGSADIEYELTFTCDRGADPIDIVDVGMPNSSYDLSTAVATINGQPVAKIAKSEYVNPGIEVHLGRYAIQPGERGTVRVRINVAEMVYPDSEDEEYASVEFWPTAFGKDFVHGTTYLQVNFHFPLGVTSEETRWHYQEFTSWDVQDDRIVFTWTNEAAEGWKQYKYGVSFPRKYVDTVYKPPAFNTSIFGRLTDALCNSPLCCFFAFGLLWVGVVALGSVQSRRRRLKYLPPTLAVEGVGIKRGLTAVEAAILLETPLNKVLTMILFGLLKKGAINVVSDKPLRLKVTAEKPEGLRTYEEQFLAAVKKDGTLSEQRLRRMMIDLIKEVNNKLKGFSRKETVAYYKDIVRRAWEQVQAGETPEVRSKRFDEGLEWLMMDKEYDEKTERTFREGPVFLPTWWWYYHPWRAATASSGGGRGRSSSAGTGGGKPVTLPTLPGAAFASTVVSGIEGVADRVVSSVERFTGGVTKVTNPPPVSTRSSGRSSSGGCACACACACAGCACACAGGGR
ncbi:MAG: hypothetical protein H5T62_06515 [Anaerolineae bacterium]|nr:hypothetical protein [Anaerolineae bacterium]